MEHLLVLKDLTTRMKTKKGSFNAVDGISLEIAAGETLALVGESGCGKSLTALSIMGLVPRPPGEIVAGEISFRKDNLLAKTEKEMGAIRGKKMAMIFQEPMTSLNPLLRVGDQLMEGIRWHGGEGRRQAWQRAVELLHLVGIGSAEARMREYPHQMSGGMRQRVMIAIALACNPHLLIADEPTTALDVTIQAQILHLMQDLQRTMGTAILLITHDLGVVAAMADRVLVMYLGRIVEAASVYEIFSRPLHPYTAGLLRSIPNLAAPCDRLQPIKGMVPNPLQKPPGCRFSNRCPLSGPRCHREEPVLEKTADGRQVACWNYANVRGGMAHGRAVSAG